MSKKEEEIEEVVETRISKFMGYCPHCELMIADSDLVGKKYLCNGCGKKIWGKDLNKEKKNKIKFESKKEYLKGNSGYYGENFHMNKSTTEYNSPSNTDIKSKIIKGDDEENTLD